MKKCSISLFIAAAALAWAPLAFSATPAKDPAHNSHHVPEAPEAPAAVPQGNPEADAQIAHLRAIRERMSRANTPEERQALQAERAQVMQQAMAGMQKSMGMAGRMQPSNGKGKTETTRMQGCQGMMGQNMALMQEMMQSMTDGQGTMGGQGMMGSGMGMGGGMMTK